MQLLLYFSAILLYTLVIAVVVTTGEGYRFVEKCPTMINEWKKRADTFECKYGKSYHCLKTIESRLIEMCLWRNGFKATKGCPVLYLLNNKLQLTQTKCFEKENFCPTLQDNDTLISDKMYQHPLCIIPPEKRFTGKIDPTRNFIPFPANVPTNQASTSFVNTVTYSSNGVMTNAFRAGGILVAVIVLMLCFMVLVQRRRIQSLSHQSQRANYMSSVPYSSENSHQYRVERIYNEIEEIDDSYLEPISLSLSEEARCRDYEKHMSEYKDHKYSKVSQQS